jgi:2-desacetyl-2-hydroxyethyl bacteriochlorophyllide A dehydrogenase
MTSQPNGSNRTIYFTGPGAVEVRPDVRPAPGPGQVLLRLRSTGICTMEQRLYRGLLEMYPVSPGHEPAAEVVEVGAGVTSVDPGDHVVVSFLPRCWQCYFCRAGESDKCVTRPPRTEGQPLKFGGFTEYALAQGYQVFRVAKDLPWHEAALGEPLACAIHSLRKADVGFGEDVLVIGGGTMGQLHVLLAWLRGARVMLSEPDENKLAVGLEHGAAIGINPTRDDLSAIVAEATEGRGVDALFITVGGDAGRTALKSMRKGGRAIFYSAYYPPMEWTMDPDWIHHYQVALIGAVNQTPEDWLAASQLLSKRIVSVGHLVSGAHPIEDIDEAMKEATNGRTFRVMIEMNG